MQQIRWVTRLGSAAESAAAEAGERAAWAGVHNGEPDRTGLRHGAGPASESMLTSTHLTSMPGLGQTQQASDELAGIHSMGGDLECGELMTRCSLQLGALPSIPEGQPVMHHLGDAAASEVEGSAYPALAFAGNFGTGEMFQVPGAGWAAFDGPSAQSGGMVLPVQFRGELSHLSSHTEGGQTQRSESAAHQAERAALGIADDDDDASSSEEDADDCSHAVVRAV